MNKKYDYLKKKSKWFSLSLDGKNPRIIIICGYNSDTFGVLGENGQLKGQAKRDYDER